MSSSLSWKRRRFLGVFGLATVGLALDRWSLFAAGAQTDCSYALNPLTPYLKGYHAPQGIARPSLLEFDLIGWEKEEKKTKGADLRIGSLRIERITDAAGITYRVDRVLEGDRCRMEIACLPDANETVARWTARVEREDIREIVGPLGF